MAYWWASQGKNYESVIVDGTLWSCPRGPNGILYVARTLLKSMRIDDIVFHYAGNHLRAVSRVVVEWQMAPRANNYPKIHSDDWDTGWLVRIEPIDTQLSMEFRELRKFIRIAQQGPLDKNGTPAQKFISSLTDAEGEGLLKGLGRQLPAENPGPPSSTHWTEVWDNAGATEVPAQSLRRVEQPTLRRFLLRGRTEAPCDICRRHLPAALLVAAHIRPRSLSDEIHRRDFASIAMLACVLGCDALFEKGLITVGGDRRIRSGALAETDDLGRAVAHLLGQICTAHNEKTAADFATHLKLAVA